VSTCAWVLGWVLSKSLLDVSFRFFPFTSLGRHRITFDLVHDFRERKEAQKKTPSFMLLDIIIAV
jgi:hypothetical protein